MTTRDRIELPLLKDVPPPVVADRMKAPPKPTTAPAPDAGEPEPVVDAQVVSTEVADRRRRPAGPVTARPA